MKVMFVETVEGSGSMGDVKDVKPGYARNYLLPKGLAVPATPHAVARAEELRNCLLYTSPSPRDRSLSRMPSSA